MTDKNIRIELENMPADQAMKVGQKKAREEAKSRGLEWRECTVSIYLENRGEKRGWSKDAGFEQLSAWG